MCVAEATTPALGLLGGTFDPVHFGHLRVAVELAEAFALPQVALVPCFQPPHRAMPVAAAGQRLAMLELAVAGNQRLAVDDCELQRGGCSFTVDTLAALRQQHGEATALYFAMGIDAFNGLAGWQNWQQLFELANIVVLSRPGYQLDNHSPVLDGRLSHFTGQHRPAGGLYELVVTSLNISATAIRAHRAAGRSISYLLPQTVEHYIHQHRLYLA